MASVLSFDELNRLENAEQALSESGRQFPQDGKGLMPFDALARFESELPIHFEDGRIRSREDAEDIIDELLDLFLLAYANGQESTNEDLKSEVKAPVNAVMNTIDKEITGKTWRQRVMEHYEQGGTIADIVRIAETETHRDSNEAAYNTARQAGAKSKTWHCLMLPTSRDSHIFLDGVSAPIDGEFYSINGGSTQFPGEWGIAEEDCGCLCFLTYDK